MRYYEINENDRLFYLIFNNNDWIIIKTPDFFLPVLVYFEHGTVQLYQLLLVFSHTKLLYLLH